MIKGVHLYPYNMASESAKLLARNLKITRIKKDNSVFRGNKNKTIINWGSSTVSEEVRKCNILNPPEAINICANKILFFNQLEKVGIARYVPFTESKDVAEEWSKEGLVVIRHVVNGHGGKGLYIFDRNLGEELDSAPLYTKYVNKKQEYRIHIFKGEPFIFQRKALPKGANVPMENWRVRNSNNGFIFARNENVEIPQDVITQARNAFASIPNLDFGSVDVLWNEYRKEAYVLEINTASGMTGSTIEDYANKFRSLLE